MSEMNEPLEAMARKLGMMQQCECRRLFFDSGGGIASGSCVWCDDSGERLPILEEVLDELERKLIIERSGGMQGRADIDRRRILARLGKFMEDHRFTHWRDSALLLLREEVDPHRLLDP